MKYGSIKHKELKTLRVSSLDGGVALSEAPYAIADNSLSEVSNMWYSGNRLKTRPGLHCYKHQALEPPMEEYGGQYNYRVIDMPFRYDGEYRQIAVSDICIDDSHYFCYIYFIRTDNKFVPAGEMYFPRTSSDIFYIPYTMTFYEGTPQNGAGIFMLLCLENRHDPDDRLYRIFEMDSDYSNWTQIKDFYIPTLYINGRGNKYALAKAANHAYNVNPLTLESPNMLNGRFHAYYTSDGYSYSFRLPFTNLDDESIVCRIYYTLVDYVEWTIGGNTILDTQDFYGAQVSMIADREKGTVYFRCNDSDYAIPVMDMYHENNIKITATKKIKKGFERIACSSCVAVCESRILVSGGEFGNEVYSATYSNPLYFPQNASVEVGDSGKEITGLAVQGSKILAFKNNEAHLITLNKGDTYNSTSLLADNDKFFTKADSFSSVCISNSIGCPNLKSFAFCGKNAIWLANDFKVYALTSLSSKTIYKISDSIEKGLAEAKNKDLLEAFAIYSHGYYILKVGKKAFIIQCNNNGIRSYSSIDSLKWLLWDFPSEITVTDGYSRDGKAHFLCMGSGGKLCYIATLLGENDIDIRYSDSNVICSEIPIVSSLTTKTFNFSKPATPKNIEAVYITLAAKGKVSIGLNGKTFTDIDFGFSDEDYNKGVYKSVKLLRNLHGVESVYITLSSSADLSVGELEISYTI